MQHQIDATPPKMPSPNLGTLIPELQQQIVDCLPNPNDLMALCRTNKALSQVATSKLYQHITIDLAQCTLPTLNGFFIANNIGRHFTKSVRFANGDNSDGGTHHWKSIKAMLLFFPQDGLRELSLPDELTLNTHILWQIVLSQRKLEKLFLCATGNTIRDMKDSPMFSWDWLQEVKVLRIFRTPQMVGGFEARHQIVSHCPKLKSLNIALSETLEKQRLGTATKSDASQADTVPFGHLASTSQISQCLEELILSDTAVSRPAKSFLAAVNFPKLKTLHLSECTKVESLLKSLTTAFKKTKPALEDFRYSGMLIDLGVMEKFLGSFPGLKSLQIFMDGTEANNSPDYINLASLESHKNSLKQLGLWNRLLHQQSDGVDSVTLHLAELAMLPTLHKLVDMAVPFPCPQILSPKDLGDFGLAIAKLAVLPCLRVLRIANYPVVVEDFMDELCEAELEESRYLQSFVVAAQHFLLRYAGEIFRILANAKSDNEAALLPLLCFSGADGDYYLSDLHGETVRTGESYYMAVTSTDRFGRTTLEARETTKKDVLYMEFNSTFTPATHHNITNWRSVGVNTV